MKHCYLLILLFCAPLLTYSQRDTTFWFAVPEVSRAQGIYSTDLDTAIYLRITAFGQATSVTVTKPADPTFVPIIRNIAANKTATVTLTPFKEILECKPPDQVLDYGLKITATNPVSVYYEQACTLNPEIFTLKGQNALSTSFWIPGQDAIPNHPYTPTPYNSFDIIATEDNTSVTITNTQAITGHAAGSTYTVTLNKGQTYSATAVTQQISGHLAGSRVTSSKPIAITLKDDLLDGSSVWGLAHDLAGDQLIPDNVIGTEYIAVRGGLTSPYDKIFILATQNNTTITQDGTLLATINAGTNYSFFMNNPSTYIQTNQPVYAVQMSGLGAEVSYGVLPPIVCTGSNAVAYVRSTTDPLYMMLLVRNGGQGNFRFNGSTSILPGSSFAAVPGTGGQWVSAKFLISTADLPKDSAVMITNSTNLFHMGVVNGTSGGGGNFGYFSNFNSFAVTASNVVLPCGDTVYLHADSIAGATYIWTGPGGYTASVANPVRVHITASDTGTYTLVSSYNGCTGTSTTQVSLQTAGVSSISLGRDTTYCGSFTCALSTGHAATHWSTGAVGPQITVSAPGLYWAEDSTTCARVRDTIILSTAVPPVVSLAADTTYCAAFSRTLSVAPATGLWSTGANASAISVSAPGTYWVAVTNQCGSARDSIVISRILPPSVHLGADTTICPGGTLILSVAPDTALWSTGATSTQITVTDTGTYWAEVTNCAGTTRDSIRLTITAPPSVALEPDTSYCGPFTRVLSVAPQTAQWSTGAIAPQITVSAAGLYWAEISNCVGSVRDTIVIAEVPLPRINLGPDDTICTGSVKAIGDSFPGATYVWNTGAMSPYIAITQPGQYIETSHLSVCSWQDTVNISWPSGSGILLPADTTICEDDVLTLAIATGTGAVWQDGTTQPYYTVSTAGQYYVTVQTACAPLSDTILVRTKLCNCKVTLPTAFSPNNDGLNDKYRVVYRCPMEEFHFAIYDRWGQKVFETTDPDTGWDGIYKNTPQPISVYAWIMSYRDPYENLVKSFAGNVTLIR